MELFCQGCGSKFEGKGTDRYCTDECRENTRKMREQSSKEGSMKALPKTCPFCKNVFIPPHRKDQIYCSDTCRDKTKWEKKKRVLTERICPICEKVFMPTVNKQICCSPECAFRKIYLEKGDEKRKHSREYRINNLELVKSQEKRSRIKNKDKNAEKYIIYHDKERFSGNKSIALERDGHKCVRCGSTEKLACHHIDGSGQDENPNNELDNLETLCDSCHTKHHNPRFDTTPHTIKTCLNCGIEFRVSDARTEDGRGKFHSKECQNAYKTKMNTVTLNCEHCGIEFTVSLSRFKRGKVKYHNAECRKAAGYAWTKYSRTEYNEQQKALQ